MESVFSNCTCSQRRQLCVRHLTIAVCCTCTNFYVYVISVTSMWRSLWVELLWLKFLRSLGKLTSENMRFDSKQLHSCISFCIFPSHLISFHFVLPFFQIPVFIKSVSSLPTNFLWIIYSTPFPFPWCFLSSKGDHCLFYWSGAFVNHDWVLASKFEFIQNC